MVLFAAIEAGAGQVQGYKVLCGSFFATAVAAVAVVAAAVIVLWYAMQMLVYRHYLLPLLAGCLFHEAVPFKGHSVLLLMLHY